MARALTATRDNLGLLLKFGLLLGFLLVFSAQTLWAQSFRINTISVEGNQRIETATIAAFTGLERGASVSAATLNDAVQNVRNSGLFETVQADVRGSTLILRVVEFPTVNRVAFEGNARLSDDQLNQLVRVAPRRVYSPSQAEADAAIITQAYAEQSRFSARVSPRIIRRNDNRVDVVFEIREGAVTEIERISFVGNRTYSDRRLRGVLETKQAGLLRLIVQSDTYIQDRLRFDQQVLTDFYQSRGYVDFQVLDVNQEIVRGRDGVFLTFRVREGQQFRVGEVTTVSDLSNVDPDDFARSVRLRQGQVYSPSAVEDTIIRMERRAVQMGLDFIRVEPRITRDDAGRLLNVELQLTRGPRVFVERIDIEGNTTTLDRVIRRQFRVVEGDPFNPREIRAAAERIRALGFFANADVNAREGSSASQVVVDVDVEEQPTGSLSFGANYSTSDGIGLIGSFSERNFLGRGQKLDAQLTVGADSQVIGFSFAEPALLGRDLGFGLDLNYRRTDSQNALYDTESFRLSPSLNFPVSENGRFSVHTFIEAETLSNVSTDSLIIQAEAAQGRATAYGLGYNYSYDNRRSGFEPDTGFFVRFGQDFALGGDQEYIKTSASIGAERSVFGDNIVLSGVLEGGALNFAGGNSSRVTDRFFPNQNTFRGFEPGGLGPREITATSNDALGGNYFAVARLEAQFPIGIPEEYGISGGIFLDAGSVWGLDQTNPDVVGQDFSLRTVAGVSIFWTTPIGPLRFNFTETLNKENFDNDVGFDLTVSTSF